MLMECLFFRCGEVGCKSGFDVDVMLFFFMWVREGSVFLCWEVQVKCSRCGLDAGSYYVVRYG